MGWIVETLAPVARNATEREWRQYCDSNFSTQEEAESLRRYVESRDDHGSEFRVVEGIAGPRWRVLAVEYRPGMASYPYGVEIENRCQGGNDPSRFCHWSVPTCPAFERDLYDCDEWLRTHVVSCLGEIREIGHRYADGSYNCPFCSYAVKTGQCENPMCPGRSSCFGAHGAPLPEAVNAFREIARRHEKERAERERRASIDEWSRKRRADEARERDEKRAEVLAECRRRGACERCLFDRYWPHSKPRFVRHRKPCPQQVSR